MPIQNEDQKQVEKRADTKSLYAFGEVDPIVRTKEVAFGRSRASTTEEAAAPSGGGEGLLQQAAEVAKEKLHDYAAKAVGAALGTGGAGAAAAPASKESSGPAGVGNAIDEAAKKAQAGVKNLAAHAAEAALGTRLAEAVPPEMRGPARMALNALGSQVAGRVNTAIADAAETAQKQVQGANVEDAPAVQSGVGHAIDEAAKKAQAGVKDLAAQAAEAAIGSRLAQAVPAEMRGPAKMALNALGAQVADRVSSAITDAAETAHKQIAGANADSANAKQQ